MGYKISFYTAAVSMIFLLACGNGIKTKSPDIAVRWEVISNMHRDFPAAKAAFTLTNKGTKALEGDGWALYFNQSARRILHNPEDSALMARVERISGDWYRVKPSGTFVLKPGEEVTIGYETSHWLTKESDAPVGLYFVFNEGGEDEQIVEVEHYTISPFVRPEQMRRHIADHLPLPSPENTFEANKGLSLLPRHELQRIVPTPKNMRVEEETSTLSHGISIIYNDDEILWEATLLKNHLANLLNWNVKMEKGDAAHDNSIYLQKRESSADFDEAYDLTIGDNGTISIEGGKRGVFYGIQSLIALIPVESIMAKAKSVELPILTINDQPRFAHRGVHIDVARNFLSPEAICKALDILSFYKINTLHMHLTDDEGWRIEIAQLPELTQVGGQRGHTTKDSPALHPAYGSGPLPYGRGKTGSGFYTRHEFIEILKYAQQRHIRVIPEINMPGHSRAAIKAMETRYLQLMEMGKEDEANEFRLIDPNDKSEYLSAQLYDDNVVNVAGEAVYRFFETVVNALVDMYARADAPLEIIHLGGDEVAKGAWSNAPMVDALMKANPAIEYHENMHAYFTQRALKILDNKGIKGGGWEEIALYKKNGTPTPNPDFATGKLVAYTWNNLWGSQDLAYRLANMGYPVVMCHATNFYFDLAYNNHPQESGLYWAGFVKTYDAWRFNPMDLFKSTLRDNMGRPIDTKVEYKNMEHLRPEAQKNILGLQAQLWAETTRGQEMLEYRLLPKLTGLSESAWGPPRRWENIADDDERAAQVAEDWNVFANTLAQVELPRLSYLFGGFNYRVPTPGAEIIDGEVHANIEFPGLQIRYSLDGSEPTAHSPLYTNPFEIEGSIKLKAFDLAGKPGRTIELKKD